MARNPQELETYLLGLLKRIAPERDVAHLAPDKNLRRQLKIDSIDFLKIVVIIHEETGYSVPETDYRKLFTMHGLMDYFSGKI